jgi:hypothetical protein
MQAWRAPPNMHIYIPRLFEQLGLVHDEEREREREKTL